MAIINDLEHLRKTVDRSFKENNHPRIICEDGTCFLIASMNASVLPINTYKSEIVVDDFKIVEYAPVHIDAHSFLEKINAHGGISEEKTFPY